jgi:hypothetical protein
MYIFFVFQKKGKTDILLAIGDQQVKLVSAVIANIIKPLLPFIISE